MAAHLSRRSMPGIAGRRLKELAALPPFQSGSFLGADCATPDGHAAAMGAAFVSPGGQASAMGAGFVSPGGRAATMGAGFVSPGGRAATMGAGFVSATIGDGTAGDHHRVTVVFRLDPCGAGQGPWTRCPR